MESSRSLFLLLIHPFSAQNLPNICHQIWVAASARWVNVSKTVKDSTDLCYSIQSSYEEELYRSLTSSGLIQEPKQVRLAGVADVKKEES